MTEEQKESCLKKYSTEIQAIAMVILVAATIYYAFSARNMASVMEKEFDIANRPYLSVDGILKDIKENEIRFTLVINNRGKIPALWNYSEFKSDDFINRPEESNMLINPTEIRLKTITFTLNKKVKEVIQDYSESQFKIEYYSSFDIERKNKYCIQYNFKYNGDPDEKVIIVGSEICD